MRPIASLLMEVLGYQSRPTLRDPVMVGAFSGWGDAGEAASTAVEALHERWRAQVFASIDPEEFYDFQVTRPRVRLVDGDRHIEWPETTFAHSKVPGASRDAVLLEGAEPSMRWRLYTDSVMRLASESGVKLVVTLGALLANRPHSRPVKVTGTAADPELATRLGLRPSRYEGPTGIVGVLTDALRRAEIPTVSLWAWVPHYVRDTPSPAASLALLRRLGTLLDVAIDLTELETEAEAYVEQINDAVQADPQFAAQVRELEEQSDRDDLEELPSADDIAEEVERYLRNHGNDG